MRETPYFFINEVILRQNIEQFQDALKRMWPNSKLAYSIKTNSLPWIINYVREHGLLAEVVSDEEYELAELCGFGDSAIVFNGPVKSDEQLLKAYNGGAIINLDSEREASCFASHNIKPTSNVGIRINLESQLFQEEDVEYLNDGFRFGFSDESNRIAQIIDILGTKHIGLHVHCNSITRSINVYREIARQTAELISKYELEPEYIDIGGGFYGGVEGKPTPTDYLRVIKDELACVVDPHFTCLILEPGSAIIGSAADLYTTVSDVKTTGHGTIVTTDGSRLHIDPLWKKSRYMYSIISRQNSDAVEKQIICGYTCMDYDRIMVLDNEKKLSTNDQIVYHRVGAYSMTLGGMFIRYLPEVYVEVNGQVEKVRARIDTKEYYKIHSTFFNQ